MPTKPAAAKTNKAAPQTTAKAAVAKPAAARKAPEKSKIAAAAAKPQIKEQSMNEVTEINESGAKVVALMKVKHLIDRVAAASDQNKKDVRAVVEATLAELGKALEAGETLILPPLGRVRIANQKSDTTGQIMTLKLRRGGEKKPGKNAAEALAEASEAS
ncbi:HU family DNA-binding protein [Cypionkella sp. TWP1-2-1b2]|uniref:HU family DNA-binding protein n=1 Tax=Cypionkella sp. TWP1-2-1b2 TaxID=2804675 RepID=UPI003CEAF179